MKNKKKIILSVVLLLVLAVLLVPSINPLLGDSAKAAATAQIQETFGGLFGGSGLLTPARLMAAVAVVLLMWLVNTVLCGVMNFIAKKRSSTRSMIGLFVSLVKFITVILAIVWALSVLGVNLAGIFASLGLMSLIIGFGAQSLIEDAITGVFIIFEGHYHIGDIIVLDEFRGTVRSIGIRTTTIEDSGGNLKIVNNSDIRNLQNRSRNSSVAISEIGMCYEDRIEDVEKILLPALEGMYERNKGVFLRVPEYKGVEALADSSVVLRVTVDTTEENVFLARRRLNRELKILFDDNNINIPFPQIVVHSDK